MLDGFSSTNFSLTKKDWESGYFAQEYYEIELRKGFRQDSLYQEISTLLSQLHYDLLEVNLNVMDITSAEIFESLGFRLVDSRITFMTLLKKGSTEFTYQNQHPQVKIRNAHANDQAQIIKLTHELLTDNPNFISRYKNTNFFADDTARKYFEKWIAFTLESPNTYSAVSELGNDIVGYFIFQRKGSWKEEALYKGILCTVDQQYQGHKLHLAMQSFLFSQFSEEQFYLDNTTQISNYPTLKNHIRSDRNLHIASLTFLKKNDKKNTL